MILVKYLDMYGCILIVGSSEGLLDIILHVQLYQYGCALLTILQLYFINKVYSTSLFSTNFETCDYIIGILVFYVI